MPTDIPTDKSTEMPLEPICPNCHRADRQVKAGRNGGVQRFQCQHCRRRYTLEPVPRGYPAEMRSRAAALHAEGQTLRRIGQLLGVNPGSVAAWLRDSAAEMQPNEPKTPARRERASSSFSSSSFSSNSPAEKAPAPVPGRLRRTIQDVARQAEVSTSTVSNFLNRKGRMSEATRTRIQNAIETLHFTPSALVRALRQRRTGILGVYIFGLSVMDQNLGGAITPPLLAGISQAADAADHNLLLYTGWEHSANHHDSREFLDGHIDGLIWVAPEMQTPTLERLAAAGLPVVALLTRHVPPEVGYVNLDNLGSIRELVAHLHALGHRRIAYAGPVHQSNFLDRREGYRQGLAAAGLPFDPALEETRLILYTPFDGCEALLDRWLALPVPPTAIVAANDGGAGHFIHLIQSRGLRVPEDLAVTGFDDISDAAHLGGGMTTIRQPFHEMGQMAVERLLALIEGAPVEECRLPLPGQMIIRASSRTSERFS